LALLKNPDACVKIAVLYGQVMDVYEGERLRYQNMCCHLCGKAQCIKEVYGYPVNPPALCWQHGASWNFLWTKRYGGRHLDIPPHKVELLFAEWLARQVVKETKRHKGETDDNETISTSQDGRAPVQQPACAQAHQPSQPAAMAEIHRVPR